MKSEKKYWKSGFEIKEVVAFINGIKYTFIKDNIFNSIGEKIV